MIKRLFSGQINSITAAALLVALSSLASRFLGIFRDRILAGEFGAGDTLDVYYAAFRVPDLVFNLLVLGALSAGFIPVFTCLIKDPLCRFRSIFSASPNKEAWLLANNVLNIMGVCLLVLSAAGVAASPWLVKLVAPGFTADKQALTAVLTRIMFLSPVFLGVSSVFGGILQSFKRFLVFSLSPVLYNIGIIVGALYLVPVWGIYGLAWGVVLGAFFHMAVQLPAVFGLGFRYMPKFDWRGEKIRQIAAMMIPRTLSLATSQINLVLITVIASTLAGGSLAIFNLANNLQSFPIGIFGISFAVAAFPALSSIAFNRKKLVEHFSAIFRQILFFIVPSTVLLLTLRAQIIRVILGTGQFDWSDTVATIDSLGFFAISLFAQASLPLLVRAFYARHNSKTPLYISLAAVAVNLILSLWLPGLVRCETAIDASGQLLEYCGPLGVSGLALAFSVASIFNFIMLWIALRLELGNLDETRILTSVAKFSAAALSAGIAVQGAKLLIWPYIDMTRFWGVLSQGLAAGMAGIAVYIAFCSLLRSEELSGLWVSFKRKFMRKTKETGLPPQE